jgi:hypothetical protein
VLGLIVLLVPVSSFYGSFAMLLPLYLLQGIGRGIFESTNKVWRTQLLHHPQLQLIVLLGESTDSFIGWCFSHCRR